jgi:hypothetical protein
MVVVVVLILGQCVTVLGTKVPDLVAAQPEVSLRQVVGVITIAVHLAMPALRRRYTRRTLHIAATR